MPTPRVNDQSRWYPSQSQLKDAPTLQLAFKQLLDQHYALVDKVNAMGVGTAAGAAKGGAATPSTATPSGTKLLGLNVQPIDVDSLADGATLTFVKADGNFQFK